MNRAQLRARAIRESVSLAQLTAGTTNDVRSYVTAPTVFAPLVTVLLKAGVHVRTRPQHTATCMCKACAPFISPGVRPFIGNGCRR